MKNIYFTLGPSQLFPGVEGFVKKALSEDILSLFHRSPKGQDIYQSATENLKILLNIPKDFHIFFLSSSTEAMEKILENCVEKNSFHFINGAFSERFYETATELKKKPLFLKAPLGEGFDFTKVKIPSNTEVICFTQNETSTGVALNPNDIYRFKKLHPQKLIAVDIVSSIPTIDLDYSMIDLSFFSVQKGFGLPAGLAVLIVSPQAFKKAMELKNKGLNIGSYHNFANLQHYALNNQTMETPNVLGLYLLNKVVTKMLKIGIKSIKQHTDKKAKLLYDFFDSDKRFEPFVKDKNLRSKTVIVINVQTDSQQIAEKLATNGIIIGTGYKQLKSSQIRIANFPAHNLKDIKKLIANL
ncbi:MAG: aminotransferase class V-fold PLP-dependent enzyme [Candidatus Daviesbacteria bacterium]|nr:aminotransferase class V-fold PLP-dependent enzyme [Candidatus Daviesbacteria bacterium]